MPGTFKRLLHYQDHVYGAVSSSCSIMLKCFYCLMMLHTKQQLSKTKTAQPETETDRRQQFYSNSYIKTKKSCESENVR